MFESLTIFDPKTMEKLLLTNKPDSINQPQDTPIEKAPKINAKGERMRGCGFRKNPSNGKGAIYTDVNGDEFMIDGVTTYTADHIKYMNDPCWIYVGPVYRFVVNNYYADKED
jgi:hypothetical protein